MRFLVTNLRPGGGGERGIGLVILEGRNCVYTAPLYGVFSSVMIELTVPSLNTLSDRA